MKIVIIIIIIIIIIVVVMLDVADSSLQADSQPKLVVGLVWGSAAAWHCFSFISWSVWTVTMTCVVIAAL